MIAALKNHYIVCGFGRVGRSAAYELQRAKAPFIVVDRSEPRVERALGAGMLAIVADATRDECLREAGIADALGLIAALPSDAENLFIILSAKTLNPKLNVRHPRFGGGGREKAPAGGRRYSLRAIHHGWTAACAGFGPPACD